MTKSIPPMPTDRVRLHVTMWSMARALGLNWTTVDSSRSDNDLLDEICSAVSPALSAEYKRGYDSGYERDESKNPYAQKT